MRRFTLVSIIFLSLSALPAVGAAEELPPGGTFVDDNGNTHEGFIEAIAAEGITLGCNPPTNDEYCPGSTVTRGQMAAFLVRALGLTVGADDPFVDDDSSIFEDDIEKLFEAGVTKGCNPPVNDRFCPDQAISRQEMAAFLVRAYGYTDQLDDPFDDDDGSIFETDIERLAAAGVTVGCGDRLFCPTAPVVRDQMASFLGRAEGLTPITPPPPLVVTLEEVDGPWGSPIFVGAPVGDDRLFVADRDGEIWIVRNGVALASPFLDIPVLQGGERGLLSMAFHPDFADNGRFYVSHSRERPVGATYDHLSIVAEYRVSADPDRADESSETVIYQTAQPYSNHNGGHIAFAPDGRLYLGLGDGGSANDPGGEGQDANTPLGSMLAIDVDTTVSTTVAIGLRNPWRWSFDSDTLYLADVGQAAWEEVNVVTLPQTSLNFGWRVYEGSACTGLEPCVSTGMTFPVYEYSHGSGCSVTGGYVYRGSALPMLEGEYFFGDYCDGWIRSFEMSGSSRGAVRDWTPELGTVSSLVSFGIDGHGELYVVRGQSVHRFVAEP